jgi:hypothetical protein
MKVGSEQGGVVFPATPQSDREGARKNGNEWPTVSGSPKSDQAGQEKNPTQSDGVAVSPEKDDELPGKHQEERNCDKTPPATD